MKKENFLYIIVSAGLFILTVSTLLDPIQSQGRDNNDNDQHKNLKEQEHATGQIVNSKYLTISGVTFNQNENTINIAGKIANNSTHQSFTNVAIVGELYDKENRLITATSGSAFMANLSPGQQSGFAITTNLPNHEEVVRYTISPSGSAVK
jgi:hypothetical protein